MRDIKSEMKREVDLSRADSRNERERRSRIELNDTSGRSEERREQVERGSFNRPSSTAPQNPSAPFFVHDHVFRVNLLPESVDELRQWIVDAAAESSNQNGSNFSFPAVSVIVPSVFLEADAAVEALGERKGSPYVMWNEAVEEFEGFYYAQHKEHLPDAASVLKRAMKHREAEGGVILYLEDETLPDSDGMIHLDPRWLIELVRRVVDHNIVDESKQAMIKAQLRAFSETLSPCTRRWSELWGAHE